MPLPWVMIFLMVFLLYTSISLTLTMNFQSLLNSEQKKIKPSKTILLW